MARYYVYILASHSRRLYVGSTDHLWWRIYRHRIGSGCDHTNRYRVNRLVYYERVADLETAVARERQLKDWPRSRKIRLIERSNAGWLDLAAGWYGGPHDGESSGRGPDTGTGHRRGE